MPDFPRKTPISACRQAAKISSKNFSRRKPLPVREFSPKVAFLPHPRI
jgi:hypothetical protein